MSDSEICGHETRDGTPCQNTPGDDGTCYLEAHTPEPDLCGHETAKGTPCQNPTTSDGDPDSCHLEAHGGTAEPPGPPKLLDEDMLEEILSEGDKAPFVSMVAPEVGIGKRTLRRWMSQGRQDLEDGDPSTIEARLWQGWAALKNDLARPTVRRVIAEAVSGEGMGAPRQLLSWLWPEEFADRTDLHVSGQMELEEKGMGLDAEDLKDEETREAVAQLTQKLAVKAGGTNGHAEDGDEG